MTPYGLGTMPSFPDLVQRAYLLAILHRWAQAEADYLLAASMCAVGCGADDVLLTNAWICHERAEGRISRLEGAS